MAQREIKFRCWDVTRGWKGEWVDGDDILESVNIIEGGVSVGLESVPKRYILEQYTGLKDKNGKEIYEGDILGMPSITDKVCWQVVWGYAKPFLGEGTKDFPTGWHFTILSTVPQYIHPDVEQMEVVGNLHENPELVEK